jgi:hypothetical protein
MLPVKILVMKRNGLHIRWILALLPLLVIAASCDRDLDLPPIEGKKNIVLLGELIAGDSFYLRAGQSVPLSQGSDLKFEVLNNLQVTAYDENGTAIPMPGKEDSLTYRLYTIPYYAAQQVKAGGKYRVQGVHNSLGTATALVDVPAAFTARIVDTLSMQYSSEPVLRVNIEIKDEPATTNYYVIEALEQRIIISESYFFYDGKWRSFAEEIDLYYDLQAQGIYPETKNDTTKENFFLRHILYTDDERTDNFMDNGKFNRNRRVLLKDFTFNGGVHTARVYLRIDTSAVGTLQQGLVTLSVKSVPEKYYRFLKAYEQSTDNGGYSTLSSPVKVQGNVENGLGMIGGAYRIKFPLYYRRLF